MLDRPARMVGTVEAASELGVSERFVRKLCADGLIEGAAQIDGAWLMPTPVKRKDSKRARGRPRSRKTTDRPGGTETSPPAIGSGADPDRIPVELIRPTSFPLRGPSVAVEPLAADIQGRGLLTPITVRPVVTDGVACFEVVLGTRRLEAVRLLISRGEWQGGIPAHVRMLSDTETILALLVDDAHSVDFDLLTQTQVIAAALRSLPELAIEQVAAAVGISVSELRQRRHLLKLPTPALAKIASGEITASAARPLLSVLDGGHAHDDVVVSVMSALDDEYELPPYSETLVTSLLSDAFNGANWYRLPDAPWVGQFTEECPVHTLRGEWVGGREEMWTCDRSAAERAKLTHSEAILREQLLNRARTDPLVQVVAPGLRDIDDLTAEQRERLGTRVEAPPQSGWVARIEGDGYWSPPTDFDRRECVTTCVWGGSLTPRGLVCTNRPCFEEKLMEVVPRERSSFGHEDHRLPARSSAHPIVQDVEIGLSGHGRIQRVAQELNVRLLGLGVANSTRRIERPNMHIDKRHRSVADQQQEGIRVMLGTGLATRPDQMWDLEEAQEMARQLSGQPAVKLLQALVTYMLTDDDRRHAGRLQEAVPRIERVTVTDNELQVVLEDHRRVAIPLSWTPWLVSLPPRLRNDFELVDGGRRIHWPDVGEAILLDEILTSKQSEL